ncbi:MAG: fatty acid cis/trans isomerase, partial [Deltaproteobacteria bacterium]|nr:fatty acid cis/trans isomerase [Candidatus Tharpella sp.]
CKGQIALNVINDHFWVMFMDPDHDLSVQYPGFLKFQKDNLKMPIEKGSNFKIFEIIRNHYLKNVVKYYHYRQDFYMTHNYKGMDYEAIWPGNRAQDAPLLTVYRHFDSGTVLRGAWGNLPRTMWVIDYPLFERIYYALVAGFDVFGNAGHQLMIRKYMDNLRVEGESYLLEFMPSEKRHDLMQEWNKKVDLDSLSYHSTEMPTRISFNTDSPKREFIEHLIKHHFNHDCNLSFDPVNYIEANQPYPELPKEYKTAEDLLQGFRAMARPGTAMVRNVNNHNANLAYVRIRVNEKDDKDDVVISIVINRWHNNVAVMFFENKNLKPELDSIDFIKGFIGSYPNYFFDVKLKELPQFLEMINNFDVNEENMEEFRKFGVNRADDDFWDHFDWFQKRFLKEQPIQAGMFDLNRYYYKAFDDKAK